MFLSRHALACRFNAGVTDTTSSLSYASSGGLIAVIRPRPCGGDRCASEVFCAVRWGVESRGEFEKGFGNPGGWEG